MRISILITILTSLIYFDASAQTMSWVASRYVQSEVCEDLSDCDNNMVCYNLKYVPAVSGTLTSYTTSFIANCNDNVSAVKNNASCSMDDNSSEIFACDSKSMILLNCSANEGSRVITEGKPVYLHQICMQVDKTSDQIVFEEPDLGQLTTSVTLEDGISQTEYIKYETFTFMNSMLHCEQQEEYLTLKAELEEEIAEISWEPTKEVEGGIYTLYQKVNDRDFVPVRTFESRMLEQTNSLKYTFDLTLTEFGDHLFRVDYSTRDASKLQSNIAEIYYRDLRFSMTVSPNPTADRIQLHVTSADSEVELRITNMEGKIVIKKTIKTDDNVTQDLSELEAGMYNVSVFSQNSQITEKVILIN